MPITTSVGYSTWAPTNSWKRAMPSTPSGRRALLSRLPSSSATYTSWWASAQSTPTKITPSSPLARWTSTCSEPRGGQQPANGSVLAARHPTSRHGNLTDQQGHDLGLRLWKARRLPVLTCWRLVDQPHRITERGGRSPLASAHGNQGQDAKER